MPSELEQPLNHKIPDDVFAIIIHYVMGMQNDTHDFSEPILRPVVAKIYPLFVIQYGILAIFGIVTNSAIIVYIVRYKLYRDVTHAFIVNLAFCYFVQCAIELPITLMVLLVQNWVFGQFWCFFLPLLQDIPLHVAIITHMLIAWDRMRWLGDPLKTRIPSFVCSCATWLTGMVIALPYPIYTTYLDLGTYMKQFRGVGICAMNLVDDMHEYMRGLFVIMYCGPMAILSYLYIRTSRELRPPDGAIGVMMFEARADAINNINKQRSSSASSGRPIRTNSSRSYDLYDAELDVTREKRTQRHLGAMAATQIICVCPLMIMKLARTTLVETYENAAHFDITYLMFVWMAFLPTGIVPWIYASWVLSRPAKERLRGYFRLSSRRGEKTTKKSDTENQQPTINDDDKKIINENVKLPKPTDDGKKHLEKKSSDSEIKANVKTISELKGKPKQSKDKIDLVKPKSHHDQILSTFFSKNTSLDPLTNGSCSNITSSTYCNNGSIENIDTDTDNASSYFTDRDSNYDKKPLCERSDQDFYHQRPSLKKHFPRNLENLTSDREIFSQKGSTTTLERDLEIIDILERERSMDIQEMIAKERRVEQISQNVSRQSSMMERRRKLPEPDYSKISSCITTKLCNFKEPQQYQNRFSPTIRDRSIDDIQNAHNNLSRKNSRNSHPILESFPIAVGSPVTVGSSTIPLVAPLPIVDIEQVQIFDPRVLEHRLSRQRSSASSRGSTSSRRYSGTRELLYDGEL